MKIYRGFTIDSIYSSALQGDEYAKRVELCDIVRFLIYKFL